MSQLLDHLGKDTLPDAMIRSFVAWCVWEQARPALVDILTKTGVVGHAMDISQVSDLETLAELCEQAGNHAQEARKRTGPLGMSTAEAAAFLMQKIAETALDNDPDAEAIAFYAAQVCGWQAFAQTNFTDVSRKQTVEEDARAAQEAHLTKLAQQYSEVPTDDTDADSDAG